MSAIQLDIFPAATQPAMGRAFAMPSADTFSIRPIREFISRHINRRGLVIDPFARNSRLADIRNDLNPTTAAESHLGAVEFLRSFAGRDDITTVLFDPPYSPRQITECYSAAGLTATMKDTQNSRFYKECRDAIADFIKPGGVVLSFGWNSLGMGRSWLRVETLLVYHGGAHNDTICVCDRLEENANDGRRIHTRFGGGNIGGGNDTGGPKGFGPKGLFGETDFPSGGHGEGAQEASIEAALATQPAGKEKG